MEKYSEQALLIACPNNCEVEKFSLRDMDKHLAECPLELMTCEFADAGCSVKLARRDLKHHMEEKQQEHIISVTLMNLKLTKESIAEKDKQLVEKDRQLAESAVQLVQKNAIIASKDRQITELQAQLGAFQRDFMVSTKVALDRFLGLNPHDFVIGEFAKLHKHKTKGWKSESFHSHYGGYKLKLHVNAYDQLKGEGHLESSSEHFLKVFMRTTCHHNDGIDLPAALSVTLMLLNQLKNDYHYTRSFQLMMATFENFANVSSRFNTHDYISFCELYRRDKEVQYI